MKPPMAGSEAAAEFVNKSVGAGGAQPSAKAIYEQRKNYAKTAATIGEISEYKVEHLATFTMERKGAILTIEDSIRKLKLLDARGKVWTQEVSLYVDDKCIKLLDLKTHEELEHFPLITVQHVQSVLNACVYDNICGLVLKEPDQKTPDIHLFQCISDHAETVCIDINSAWQDIKQKKGKRNRQETLRKQRESVRSKLNEPPDSLIGVKERVAAWTTTIAAQADVIPPTSPRSTVDNQHENSPEMIAFKVQRDVQMLNHGLDDIEIFVTHLQKSAEAVKELASRKLKKRSKRKLREPGIGMLELRAKAPSEEMYIDCFQKFKFCFNLLAKLKLHIENPNAVELVHFLFQPLSMIINSCGVDLPRSVQCPLLNKETLPFLQNCCTSMELHLCQQLGEYWNNCRTDFPRDVYFAPYIPQFCSGWEPPPLPFMEAEVSELAAAIAGQADQVQLAEKAWKAGGGLLEDVLKSQSPPLTTSIDPTARKSSIPEATSAFMQHVQSHVARNQALQNTTPQSSSTPQSSTGSLTRKICRATQDFSARNDRELTFNMDDLLEVLNDEKGWWLVRNNNNETGYVPGNFMLLLSSATKPHTIPPPPKIPPSSTSESISMSSSIPAPPSISIPPPPPVGSAIQKITPVPITSVQLRKTTPKEAISIANNTSSSDSLQEELKMRVTSQKQRHFVIPRKSGSSSELVITRASTKEDVRHFLKAHGFNQVTYESLGVLNGEQLFTLTKDDLKQVCEEESSRVYSQLLVQKGMQSSNTRESELDKIMKKRRQEDLDDEW